MDVLPPSMNSFDDITIARRATCLHRDAWRTRCRRHRPGDVHSGFPARYCSTLRTAALKRPWFVDKWSTGRSFISGQAHWAEAFFSRLI